MTRSSCFLRCSAVLQSKTEAIPREQRNSQLLTQFIPALVGQNHSSGYVGVHLSNPGASFALFGRQDLEALSAVPAQAVP